MQRFNVKDLAEKLIIVFSLHAKSLQLCSTLTLWTIAHQASLSMGISRQEYWNGLPCPSPGDLPNLGIEPASLMSPALAGRFFTTSATWVTAVLSLEEPKCPIVRSQVNTLQYTHVVKYCEVIKMML